MRRMAWALVALAAMAAWGRGGEGKYSSPTATFRTLQAAVKAGDRRAAEACFTARAGARPDGHEDICGELQELLRRARKVELGKEEITDDTATLEYRLDGRRQLPLAFTREGEAWKTNRYVPLERGGEPGPAPRKAGNNGAGKSEPVSVDDLPAAVVATALTEAAGWKVRSARRWTHQGRTFYTMKIRPDGKGFGEIVAEADGRLIFLRQEGLAPEEAPAAVKAAFLAGSGGRPIGMLNRSTFLDVTVYQARPRLPGSATVELSADGTPVDRGRVDRALREVEGTLGIRLRD